MSRYKFFSRACFYSIVYFTVSAYTYAQTKIDTNYKYRKEDSLDNIWADSLMAIYPMLSDSFNMMMLIINDSAGKVMIARNVNHIYVGPPEKRAYYDSIRAVLEPIADEKYRRAKQDDSSNGKKHPVIFTTDDLKKRDDL